MKDKDELVQAFNLSALMTLTGEANSGLSQGFSRQLADTAITKVITDPDEEAQESFEFTRSATYTRFRPITVRAGYRRDGLKGSASCWCCVRVRAG